LRPNTLKTPLRLLRTKKLFTNKPPFHPHSFNPKKIPNFQKQKAVHQRQSSKPNDQLFGSLRIGPLKPNNPIPQSQLLKSKQSVPQIQIIKESKNKSINQPL
jgi:hypothetical protein